MSPGRPASTDRLAGQVVRTGRRLTLAGDLGAVLRVKRNAMVMRLSMIHLQDKWVARVGTLCKLVQLPAEAPPDVCQ